MNKLAGPIPPEFTAATDEAPADADPVVESDLFVEDDLLVEDVSIDGMCGVY